MYKFLVSAAATLLLCNYFLFPILLKSLGLFFFQGRALTLNPRQTFPYCLSFSLWAQVVIRERAGDVQAETLGEVDREGAPKRWEMVVEVLGAVGARKAEKRRNTINDKNWSITVYKLVLLGTEEYANL